MKSSRRTFLGGMLTTAFLPDGVVSAGADEKPEEDAAKVPINDEFPILWLELCGKYPGEEGTGVITHLTSRRIVSVDLENEDEWGDLNTFWTGTEMAWGLGNDVDGYWKIERAFELVEPRIELHENKFPVGYELTMEQLDDLMNARVESWR